MTRRRARITKDVEAFKADGWTASPNALIRDTSLSPAARWAWSWMNSNDDGWMTSAQDIADAGGCGVHAAEDLLYELERAGYLCREYTRNRRGQVTGMDFKLQPLPVPEDKRTYRPRQPRSPRKTPTATFAPPKSVTAQTGAATDRPARRRRAAGRQEDPADMLPLDEHDTH